MLCVHLWEHQMIRSLSLLSLFLFSQLQAFEKYDHLDGLGDPSIYVEGYVNALTGALVHSQADLVVDCPEELSFIRNYNCFNCYNNSFGSGFTHNHPTGSFRDEYDKKTDTRTIYVGEKSGNCLKYSDWKFSKHSRNYYLDEEHREHDLTNTYSGKISGRHNLKNSYLTADGRQDRIRIREMKLGDGTVRKYNDKNQLSTEIRPSGNQVKYYYSKDQLCSIQAFDRNGKACLGWINFYYNSGMLSSIKTSDGKIAKYTCEMKRIKKHCKEKLPLLKKVQLFDQPKEILYSYDENVIKIKPEDGSDSFRIYERKISGHSGGMHRSKCEYGSSGKISKLTLFGPQRRGAVYYFCYPFYDRGTIVITPLKAALRYTGSSVRVGSITTYLNGTFFANPKDLYRKQRFYWGEKEKTIDNRGNLTIKALEDSNEHILCAASYIYDHRGNVLKETLYGNLTGKCDFEPIKITKKNEVVGQESFHHTYTYTDDGRNLVLTHEDGDGVREEYEYVPGSNRVSQILTIVNDQVVKRQCYTYNSFMALTSVREDNGSSRDVNDLSDVTSSTVQMHTLIEDLKTSGFGKPEETIEGYLNPLTGVLVQLKRQTYTYGKYNLVTSQTVYDADDRLCFTLTFDYDSYGRCIRETDCFGVETVYKYNTHNCCVFSKKEGVGYSTSFAYDSADRMIEKRELHESGEEFVYTFAYDVMGNLIEQTDAYGNVKKMTYDSLGRHIKTEYPPVFLADGTTSAPTEEMVYDIFDRIVEEKDPLGNVTQKRYTARGQLAEIVYPDGTSERYVYNLNGSLHQKYEKNGSYHTMVYDEFQQLVRDETYSSDGNFLRKKEFVYDQGLLIYEIDASGTVTEYRYDFAGRKSAKLIHGEEMTAMETYAYDSLGRLCGTKKWLSEEKGEYLNYIQEFDCLNRVTLNKIEDHHGKTISWTSYCYDINGNCVEERCQQTEKAVSVAKAEYASYSMPLVTIDPMGNATCYHYDFSFENVHGQKVFRSTVINPKGVKMITTKDVLGRDVETHMENAEGVLLSKGQSFYDLKGNKTLSLTDSIVQGVVNRTYEVKWVYDAMDRVVRIIEDPKEKFKETQFTYHPMGMLETKRKADGVLLSYFYDDLGRESEMFSSDQSVHYTYEYNLRDQLIRSVDSITGKTIERRYDSFGNLIEEVLPSGMRMRYQYDPFCQILKITLPDESAITYTYDLAEMTTVSRFSPDQSPLYTHHYTSADMQGRSLKSVLITGDEVDFKWDLNGRPTKISSLHFTEEISEKGYDSVGNLLQADFINGGKQYSNIYNYDELNQLIYESTTRAHDYRYDSLHNRLSKDSDDYALNSLNQVEQCEAHQYQFDLNGNTISQISAGNEISYTYDALNRLRAVEREGIWKIEYQYDSFGRRISAHHFKWAGENLLEEEREYLFQGIYEIGYRLPSGEFPELRVMGKREGPAFRTCIAFELQGETYAPLYDHIFNVVALLDLSSGDLKAAYRYSAFGEMQELISSSIICPWLFSNQRYTRESNLYHFGKRDYRPAIGRWISPDPGDFIDGMNLYAYTRNCPTMHLDFYGFSTQPVTKRPIAEPVYGGFVSCEIMDYLVKGAGKCCEVAAHNILPESTGRFAIEGIARVMQGESFVPDNGFVLPSVSGIVPGRPLDGIRVRYIPGIGTLESGARATAEKISGYLRGAEVHWTCQQSRGFVQDLGLCMAEMMHIRTPAIQHLSEQIRNDYWEMRAIRGDNFLLFYIDHSRGGLDFYEATRNLPREMRDKMFVLALGSAKLFDARDYKLVKNYSNDYDIVNFIANLTCSHHENVNLIYTEYCSGSGNPLSCILDHLIESGGYQDTLWREIQFLLENGI